MFLFLMQRHLHFVKQIKTVLVSAPSMLQCVHNDGENPLVQPLIKIPIQYLQYFTSYAHGVN